MKAGAQAEAERMTEEAFALSKDFDAHDPRRVNIRLLRGEVARNGGKPDAAEKWYRDGVSAAETAFGDFAPELIFPLEALANIYSLNRKPARAIPVDERLLAIAEHARPADPLDVARRCRNLADAFVAAGQSVAAEPYYRRSVQLAESFRAELRPDTAEYLRAFGDYLLHERKLPEALAAAERGLNMAGKSLGPEDLGLCAHLETCGDIHLAAKNPDAAASLYERSLHLVEHAAGPDNADLARPLVRLAAAERARGNRRQAESLCERATAVVTHGLGADVPEMAPVLEERAALLEELKRPDEAAALRRRAAELRKRAAG
jgi:tetratricopeptide (TPR) repeat protein